QRLPHSFSTRRSSDLRRVKPAIDLIGKHSRGAAPPAPSATSAAGNLDTAALAKIAGHDGEQTGAVYKITVGRDDLHITEMGAPIDRKSTRLNSSHQII